MNQYTRASDRALIGDAQFWSLESQAVPLSGAIPGQKFFDATNTWYTPYNGQSTMDMYRHGRFPAVEVSGTTGRYKSTGGKVAYNVLFCDGHVATLNDRESGYRATRMRFPG